MNEYEQRLERIEDSLIEIAEAVEEGEFLGLRNRIGDILFEGDIDD